MKAYNLVHKNPPLAPVLNKFSPVYTLILYFLNVLTDLLLSLSSDLLPPGYQIKYFMRYTFSSICCTPLIFHHSNNNLRGVQIMKLSIISSFIRAVTSSEEKTNKQRT